MSKLVISNLIWSTKTLQFFAIGAVGLALTACQQPQLAESELQTIQTASDVYRAYERGDCGTVHRLTGEDQLRAWGQTELRYSLMLAKAFCFEREGEEDMAMATYEMLENEAGSTFAGADAAERIHLLRTLASDPGYKSWVEERIANAKPNLQSRTPLSRIPADFPPAARAAGVEGYAVVEFRVTADGETKAPIIVDSDPPFLFDGTSLRAVRQWQFMQDPDMPNTARQVIRIVFQTKPEITSEDVEVLTE